MGEKKLKCMRLALLVFNAIYSISGGILLGLGIWAAVEKLFLSQIIGNDLYSAASYLIIATGAILLLVSFLGCLGVCVEIRCMLVSYFLMLLVIFVFLLLSAVLAIIFHGKIEHTMKGAMKETLLQKYGTRDNEAVTDAWDTTQAKFNCCAVAEGHDWSFLIYKHSKWFNNTQTHKSRERRKLVPASCCTVRNVPGSNKYYNVDLCQSHQLGPPRFNSSYGKNSALHMKGCYKVGYEYIMNQSEIVMAVAITFAVCLVAGMILAMCVWRNIPPLEYESTSSRVV